MPFQYLLAHLNKNLHHLLPYLPVLLDTVKFSLKGGKCFLGMQVRKEDIADIDDILSFKKCQINKILPLYILLRNWKKYDQLSEEHPIHLSLAKGNLFQSCHTVLNKQSWSFRRTSISTSIWALKWSLSYTWDISAQGGLSRTEWCTVQKVWFSWHSVF